MARWEVLRCLIYSRPGEGVRAPGSEPPSARSRALVPTSCRVPVCWPRSAARSSAPPDSSPSPVSRSHRPRPRPRPSSPRLSEVRRRALPLPPLFTNLVQEPELSRGATSPAAPGGAAGMLSASPAGGGGLAGARGLSVGRGLGTLGDSPASPREVAYTEQRNPLCGASLFPSVK